MASTRAMTMASTRREKRIVPRGRQSRPRGVPVSIPDDETSSEESSTDESSSDAGLTSDEEGAATLARIDSLYEAQDDGASTDGEGSVFSDRFSTNNSEDPLARLLASDQSLTRMEINLRYLKEWSSALPIEDIMYEIARQPSIKTLCFDLDHVTMSRYDVVFKCIKQSETLETLILMNARFNRHTANAIATALFDNPNSLKELTFKGCPFAGSGFSIMFLGVQHVPGLTHLSIEDCSLQGFASEIISATIPFLKKLTTLRLVKTQLPTEGLRYLFDNLPKSANLVGLDLSQNEFDTQSIAWLVGCLQSSDTKIEQLTLNKCGLDTSCVEVLCRGLTDDQTLVELSLAKNAFGDSGAVWLVNMIKSNHHLQDLSLHGCGISKKLLKLLLDGIRYNNSFLKNVFSSEVSLAILDSFSMMDNAPESLG